MKSSSFSSLYGLTLFAVLLFIAPSAGHAATPAPSCVLFVSTPDEFAIISSTDNIVVQEGERVVLSWLGSNAQRASRNTTESIPLIGVSTMTIQKTGSQSFEFTTGSKSATCAVTFRTLEVQIDTESLISERSTPTLSGDASGIDTLSLEVWNAANTKKLYVRDSVSVKKGGWKAKISKKLRDDAYTVRIYTEEGSEKKLLLTETLNIGDKEIPTSSAHVVVEPIPLLTGGSFKSNQELPVSYLQILNIGKESARITGLTVRQDGSADPAVVVSLTIHEHGQVIGSSSSNGTLFKKDEAVINTNISLAPGESRVITLKAYTADDVRAFIGTDLKLNVTEVETNASLKARFPIRGTTWRSSL